MVTDVIKIQIKIKNEFLLAEEKTDLIISNLKTLIEQLKETNGDIQQLKGSDDESSIEYIHLKNNLK